MARTFLYLVEVARECRASTSTVRHWIAVGRLRGVRPGRRLLVTREDLDRFIEDSTRRPRESAQSRVGAGTVDPRQLPLVTPIEAAK
jgi:excisionase family DNA binding protein